MKASVTENVKELRRALGSASGRLLSREDLADLLNKSDPSRVRGYSTVERWEKGVEPDYASARAMADLAGVTFEEFALGVKKSRARGTPVDERGEAATTRRGKRGA